MFEDTFFDRGKKRLNIDITYRCPLECPRCPRQTWYRDLGNKVPGYDITLTEFDIITEHFSNISFCGQYSDPIHHPYFIDILKICKQKNITAEVHVASSYKSKDWFIKTFQTNPNIEWIFGIDGLPEESHIYRKNQDGHKLYQIMLEAKKYLNTKPVWQYIIFKYNESNVEKALSMAKNNGLDFIILNSSRWKNDNDPLKPNRKL